MAIDTKQLEPSIEEFHKEFMSTMFPTLIKLTPVKNENGYTFNIHDGKPVIRLKKGINIDISKLPVSAEAVYQNKENDTLKLYWDLSTFNPDEYGMQKIRAYIKSGVYNPYHLGDEINIYVNDLIALDDNKYKMLDLYHDAYGTMTEIPNREDKLWDTSELTTMNSMFYNCLALTTLDLSKFDTSKVTNMNQMFVNCFALTTLDLSHFDTSKVTNMSQMFYYCKNLASLDLSNFNTSNVTDMGGIFNECSKITSLDLSNFDTSKVTNMSGMFFDCQSLTTIKGVIDMKSCTSYNVMFKNCSKLTGVKIKNPPADFEAKTGLTSSQYEVVQ